jgi:hypothetical protein
LDNEKDLSGYFKKTDTDWRFGKVVKGDGTEEELYLRDLTNKILHSSGIEWQLVDQERPVLVCHSDDPSRWARAEISISAVAALCGRLMS